MELTNNLGDPSDSGASIDTTGGTLALYAESGSTVIVSDEKNLPDDSLDDGENKKLVYGEDGYSLDDAGDYPHVANIEYKGNGVKNYITALTATENTENNPLTLNESHFKHLFLDDNEVKVEDGKDFTASFGNDRTFARSNAVKIMSAQNIKFMRHRVSALDENEAVRLAIGEFSGEEGDALWIYGSMQNDEFIFTNDNIDAYNGASPSEGIELIAYGEGGDDVYDISKLTLADSKTLVIFYGWSKDSVSASDEFYGFDKIIVDNAADSYELTGGGGKSFSINGVTFNLLRSAGEESIYVKINGSLYHKNGDKLIKEGGDSQESGDSTDSSTPAAPPEDKKEQEQEPEKGPEQAPEQEPETSGSYNHDVADKSKTVEIVPDEGDETATTQSISESTSVSDINETFATANAGGDATTKKYLTVGSETWDSTIEMGTTGTNYIVFDAGSTASGEVDKSKSAGVIAFADTNADLSNVTVKNYDSTKDTLMTTKILTNYLDETENGATSNFIDKNTGKFGTDLMKNSGSLAATQKNGLYQVKYRETYTGFNRINNEVLVVAGGDTAAKGDFTKNNTAIFAMTDNNNEQDSVKGSASQDFFVAGAGDNIDGGKGDDVIRSYKSTVQLATHTEGNDIINNWDEYDENDESNNVLSMNSAKNVKDFELSNFTVDDNGNFVVTLDDGSSDAGAAITTTKTDGDTFKMRVKANKKTTRVVNGLLDAEATITIQNEVTENVEEEYTALLMNNTTKNVTIDDSDFNNDMYVGVKEATNQVSFGTSLKKNIFLGASGDGEEWCDSAVYSNVLNVKTSTVGESILFNGSGEKATLEAGGANDSIWGAGGSSNDVLVSNEDYRTFFATGNDNGHDTLQNFQYGLDTTAENKATDVVYFLDGANYLAAGNGKFVAGSSKDDNLTFEGDSGVNDITFGFNLGGATSTARIDMTDGGNQNIEFDEKAMWYIGQGAKSGISFDNQTVQFGFNSINNAINIATLDGSNALEGSIINGANDIAQKVIASSEGASSIAGGFGEGFMNATNDTLVGGGDGNDTFYVGQNMGNDIITNVVDGDKVVFLGTKFSDVTGLSNNGNGFSVSFANARIDARLATSEDMANMKNLTAVFDDGEFGYNGSTWARKTE